MVILSGGEGVVFYQHNGNLMNDEGKPKRQGGYLTDQGRYSNFGEDFLN